MQTAIHIWSPCIALALLLFGCSGNREGRVHAPPARRVVSRPAPRPHVSPRRAVVARNSARPVRPKVVLAFLTKRRIKLRAKIQFPPNKATIPKRSFAVLDQVVEILKNRPHLRVEVQAHLGTEPKEYYGRRPSHRRAVAVRRYLIYKGIAPGRVRARGYGGTKPLTLGRTAAERAINRRVEFILF